MNTETTKKKIQDWWNDSPCCSKVAQAPCGTKEFYEQVDLYKDTYEPFTNEIADYANWKNKRILEIGCGLGKDFSRFISAGAKAAGIDVSVRSLELTAKRLEIFNLNGNLSVADAENLPFKNDVFDLIFSWGVLHHTPGTQKAMDEICRCLNSNNGKIIIMLYNRRSPLNLCYTILSLFSFNREKRLAALTDGIGNPLSKVYSQREALNMFLRFRKVNIYCHESRSSPFMKIFNTFKILEKHFGWFMVIKAEK